MDPEVDRSRGYDKVNYTSFISPVRLEFSPSLDIQVYPDDLDSETGTSFSAVSTMAIEGEIQLVYRSGVIHIQTAGGVISRSGGLGIDDKFLLASDFRPLPAPDLGKGLEIRFDSLPDRPTRFSLYYPTGGPNILAFFGDSNQQSPTTVSDFLVDGKALRDPEIVVIQNPSLVMESGPFHFLAPKEQLAGGDLKLSFGGSGLYIRGVSVVSSDGSVIEFRQNLLKNLLEPSAEQTEAEILRQIIPEPVSRGLVDALSSFGAAQAIDVVRLEELQSLQVSDEEARAILNREKYAPVLEYPLLSTNVPLTLAMRAKVPGSWDVGQRTVNIAVRTANGYQREIPIDLKVVDPYSAAWTTLTGLLGALMTAGLMWLVIERRKLAYQRQNELNNERLTFFKQNYAEYMVFRDEVQQRLQSSPTWRELEELLRKFVGLRLQTVLSNEEWERLRSLGDRRMTKEVLELLHRCAWIDGNRLD